MFRKDKFKRTEVLCLRKSGDLEKVIENVPKPSGAIPKFGLPKWKTVPLELKIPLVPGPKGAYYFSRKKVGEKLLIRTPDTEFNTSDPYNHEFKLEHDELHDEHLTDFHKRPANIERMIKLGFVTENLDAKCSGKEYNEYRKFLRKLHGESVKKTLNKQADIRLEEINLKLAEESAKKNLERLKKREKTEMLMEEVEKRNIIKQNEFKSIISKYEEKLKKFEQHQKKELCKRKCKINRKIEQFRKVCEMGVKIESRRVIKIIVTRKEQENKRIKLRKIRLREEEKERKKLLENRWKKQQQFQIEQMEKENIVKNSAVQESQKFIQEYNKKIEKDRKRMQKLLENRKKTNNIKRRFVCQRQRRNKCKIKTKNKKISNH